MQTNNSCEYCQHYVDDLCDMVGCEFVGIETAKKEDIDAIADDMELWAKALDKQVKGLFAGTVRNYIQQLRESTNGKRK